MSRRRTLPAGMSILAIWMTLTFNSAVLAVTTNWIANSGVFTTPANWDNGVPDSDDTAVFDRGFVAYEVHFPGGSIFDPPPNYPIEYLRVRTNEVSFVYTESPFVTIPSLSVLNPAGSVVVGENAGDVAILNMTLNRLSGGNASIGANPGTEGTLNVSGTFSLSGTLNVGSSGTGTMNIAAGGRVESINGGLGLVAGSQGVATVSGIGSSWMVNTFGGIHGALNVGTGGVGRLNILDGGTVTCRLATIGSGGGVGRVAASGAGSRWSIQQALSLGSEFHEVGGFGSLTIDDGAAVTSGFAIIGSSDLGGGEVVVNGPGSIWTSTAAVGIGGNPIVNESGGVGTVSIGPGAKVFNVSNAIRIYPQGTLNLQGGTLQAQSVSLEFSGGQFHFTVGKLHVGTFFGDLQNQGGAVAPGPSTGGAAITSIMGNYTQQAAAKLEIEIGGLTSAHDKLAITGNALLDGTLHVSLINGFQPSAGQSFDILDAPTIGGMFNTLQLPILTGGLVWNTSQLYSNGVLIVAPPGVSGDYNGNGIVDAADYVLWRNGGPLANEVDTPGVVNAADYTEWRARFGNTGSGAGSGATSSASAVPEPASVFLLLSATAAGLWLRLGRVGSPAVRCRHLMAGA